MRWRLASAALLVTTACSSKATDPAPMADELAAGLVSAIAVVENDRKPLFCAVLPSSTAVAELALEDGSSLSLAGYRLDVELAGDRPARVAIVGDARERSGRAAANIGALIKQWDAANVSVVFALGGMEEGEAALLSLLAPMVTPRRALVAMPGDRENVAALDKVIATLRGQGLPAFATSEVRLVTLEGLTFGLFPGVASEAGLVSGGDGCLHREEDAAALAEVLAVASGAKAWLSYAAPRQRGESISSSDLSFGVHAGELAQVAAIARASPQLVFHGQIEPAADGATSGAVNRKATATTSIAVPAIETLPIAASARPSVHGGVIVELGRSRLEWRATAIAGTE